MEFLGNTWWIWLISGFGAIFVGVIVHLVNLRLMHRSMAQAIRNVRNRPPLGVPYSPRSSEPQFDFGPLCRLGRFFKRFGFAMIFFFIAGVCEVLFVLGAIVRIIEIIKEGTGA